MKQIWKEDVICWWSGGVTSAVACYLALEWFGIERCRFVFIDTKNEADDTYRFKEECEAWYGKIIESISHKEAKSIQGVWRQYNGMNFANGAICSSVLKRDVRIQFNKENSYSFHVFGFDSKEQGRGLAMRLNYPELKAIFPLMAACMDKKACIKFIETHNTMFTPLHIPQMYQLGFSNNNCFKTGCVQGGAGYWQKIQREFPEKFETMAAMEHELTNKKGEPVTILRKKGEPVFLKIHPKYPQYKDISSIKGREPEPLIECNGFCGTNDKII